MRTEIKRIALLFLLTVSLGANAQFNSRMSNETEIIFVINADNFEIQDLMRYSDAEKLGDKLGNFYPKSVFYRGVLEGRYSLEKYSIKPVLSARATLLKNKRYFPGDNFFPRDQLFPGDNFFPGDQFEINGVYTTILSDSKTKLVLQTGKGNAIKSPINQKLKGF